MILQNKDSTLQYVHEAKVNNFPSVGLYEFLKYNIIAQNHLHWWQQNDRKRNVKGIFSDTSKWCNILFKHLKHVVQNFTKGSGQKNICIDLSLFKINGFEKISQVLKLG